MGVAHAIKHIVPLIVMCDPGDVHIVPQVKSTHSGEPTIYLYDRYPGGIGLSEKLYEKMEHILSEAKNRLINALCESGCPSCVGLDA